MDCRRLSAHRGDRNGHGHSPTGVLEAISGGPHRCPPGEIASQRAVSPVQIVVGIDIVERRRRNVRHFEYESSSLCVCVFLEEVRKFWRADVM